MRTLAVIALLVNLCLAYARAAYAPTPTYADVEYADVNGISLRLDIYLPAGSTEPFPLVIFIHGGGWSSGNKASPRGCGGLLDQGIAVASINYRLSGQAAFPAQIHDCKAAIRWLRAHAARYGFDPTRFAVMGSSAGGHLAALVGTSGDVPELEGNEGNLQYSSRVQAVFDLWGPTDLLVINDQVTDPPGTTLDHDACTSMESRLIGACLGEIKAEMDYPVYAPYIELLRQANPITWISPDDPPFLIWHGDMDATVPLGQSLILHDALLKAGLSSTLWVIPGGTHGMSNLSYAPGYEFFRNHLSLAPMPARRIGHYKTCYEGSQAESKGKIVTTVRNDRIYIEEPDRGAGIMVSGAFAGISVGDVVDVSGMVTTLRRSSVNSERQLTHATVKRIRGGEPVEPLLMTCRSVGGEDVCAESPGVLGGRGLNNIGLLVTIVGKITYKGGSVINVDDGSKVQDPTGRTGVFVQLPAAPVAAVGDTVRVTGVVEGNVYTGTTVNRRYIRTRTAGDLVVLKSAASP